jgi:hypothetical protein
MCLADLPLDRRSTQPDEIRMPLRVIPDAVSRPRDGLRDGGESAHKITDHEERGRRAGHGERLQDRLGRARVGPVVEREIQDALGRAPAHDGPEDATVRAESSKDGSPAQGGKCAD